MSTLPCYSICTYERSQVQPQRLLAQNRSVSSRLPSAICIAAKGLLLASLAFAPSDALANTVKFELDEALPGSQSPILTGNSPWATVTISDTTNANQVSITVQNNLAPDILPGGGNFGYQRITQIALNVDPYVQVGLDSAGSNGWNLTSSQDGKSLQPPKSDAATKYDLLLTSSIRGIDADSSKVFIVTDITSPSSARALSANSFNSTNEFGWYVAANIEAQNSNNGRYSPCQGGRNQSCTYQIGKRKIPGPLPLLGAVVAFSLSRRIRTRVAEQQRGSSPHSSSAFAS